MIKRSDSAVAALGRLRTRLTAWYVGTFALILALLGVLLFNIIARQTKKELVWSLHAAANQVVRATAIREREEEEGGPHADAIEELRIPDRTLILFDSVGRLVAPVNSRVAAYLPTVRRALTRGPTDDEIELPNGQTLAVFARTFVLRSGHLYVALASADKVELEDRHARLIVTFIILSCLALGMVAVGGMFLARKVTTPIEHSIEYTRRFMADAAHELRTPIAVLRSRAEVTLQRERDDASYVTALRQIGVEAEQLGRIVDDLLILARADTGERPLRRDELALDEIVLDAVTAAGALASSRQVQLEVDIADEVKLVADPVLLRQLIMILIDNAIKYTPAGGSVTVDVIGSPEAGTVAVRDTGPGISADELPRVFDRFYRGEASRGKAVGAGLGLSIARWIADAHHARLSVESEAGAGTTFRVAFPREKE